MGDKSNRITTIKISKKIVGELSILKIHHRQSYEEVIVKLLENYKKNRGKEIRFEQSRLKE